MCGYFGTNANIKLKNAEHVLRHRGPDNFGKTIYENWKFFHNRLSIIDLKDRANQPYVYKNLICLYNGEVYNFQDIKIKLIELGYNFETTSDTEVVVKAYHKWGEKSFPLFNGMFSITFFDKKSEKLTLVRDRFGVKPIYYSLKNEKLFFGSELKSLFAMGIEKEINKKSISNYIANGQYCNNESTFFKDISEVKPGYFMEYEKGILTKYKWYELPKKQIKIDLSDAVKQFNFLLKSAIEIRLNADVPVSLSLSGGLDSSSIVHRVFKYGFADNINTIYHWTSNNENDESSYAQIIAKNYGKELTKSMFSKEDFFPYIDKTLKNIEQPFGGLNTATSLKTFETMLDKKNKIILSGDGADEVLGGYNYHINAYSNNFFNYNFQNVQGAENLYDSRVLTKSMLEEVEDVKHTCYFKDPLKDSMYNDLAGSKLRRALNQSDANSMSCSVEMRFPFLDYRLVEFCYSLNNEYLIKNGNGKYLLRKSNNENIFSWVKKRPLQTPQTNWIKNDFFHIILNSCLKNDFLYDNNIFDRERVNSSLNEWKVANIDNSVFPWQILMIDRFIKLYFG